MEQLAELLKQLASGQIPREVPEGTPCAAELRELSTSLTELLRFTRAMCAGDLSAKLNCGGPLAGSLKGLHANLRHLTWQTQQVAAGDFSQRVDFLGEFSSAFNSMVAALDHSRSALIENNAQLEAAVDELRATQAKLLQQEKMASIGQLAAGVAHEINNPMGFILSNLHTLNKYANRRTEYQQALEQALDNLAQQHPAALEQRAALDGLRGKLKIELVTSDIGALLAEAIDGGERVAEIVRNLKSFARLDEQEWKPADLNAGLESTLNIVGNELKYKATVRKEFCELPQTWCNPGQLNQVFMNLLVNAAQAMETPGEILVKTSTEDACIVVEVADNGPGIPPATLSRIFEPFFTTKEVGQGTGLGLAISYDIVKQHGGEITVESTPGEGTRFRVSLPLTTSPPNPAPVAQDVAVTS